VDDPPSSFHQRTDSDYPSTGPECLEASWGGKQYIMYINLDLFFLQPWCRIRFVSRNLASDLALSPDLPKLSLSVQGSLFCFPSFRLSPLFCPYCCCAVDKVVSQQALLNEMEMLFSSYTALISPFPLTEYHSYHNMTYEYLLLPGLLDSDWSGGSAVN